jgi:glutathione S-transferase
VYLDPCTVNSRKVLAGLELVGMPYELRHVDYFTGAHKKPEFLAINPNGVVPAVVDGDFALSESNAILQYTADLIGSEKHYPKDLKQRADINRWLLWEASTWFPSCYIYLVEYVVKPLLNTAPDEAVIEKETPNWHRLAGILDARLARSKWLAGDTVTIADIAGRNNSASSNAPTWKSVSVGRPTVSQVSVDPHREQKPRSVFPGVDSNLAISPLVTVYAVRS